MIFPGGVRRSTPYLCALVGQQYEWGVLTVCTFLRFLFCVKRILETKTTSIVRYSRWPGIAEFLGFPTPSPRVILLDKNVSKCLGVCMFSPGAKKFVVGLCKNNENRDFFWYKAICIRSNVLSCKASRRNFIRMILLPIKLYAFIAIALLASWKYPSHFPKRPFWPVYLEKIKVEEAVVWWGGAQA